MKKFIVGMLIAGVIVSLGTVKDKPKEDAEKIQPFSSPGNGGVGGNATG